MRARVGVFGIGLAAYWPQFEGLRATIEGHLRSVESRIEAWADVVPAGLIDTAQAGAAAGDIFAREDLDLLFCYAGTYATSTQVLPVVQRAKVPVVLLNLQPVVALDYTATDPAWHGLLDESRVTRSDFPEADHTFSAAGSRERVEAGTLQWLAERVVGKGA